MKKYSCICGIAMSAVVSMVSACNMSSGVSKDNKISSIEFRGHGSIEMFSGEKRQLDINVIPENHTDSVVISKSSECVSVNDEWVVTAKFPGTAVLKASSRNGKVSDKCIIRVMEKNERNGEVSRNPEDIYGMKWAIIDLGNEIPSKNR